MGGPQLSWEIRARALGADIPAESTGRNTTTVIRRTRKNRMALGMSNLRKSRIPNLTCLKFHT